MAAIADNSKIHSLLREIYKDSKIVNYLDTMDNSDLVELINDTMADLILRNGYDKALLAHSLYRTKNFCTFLTT